MPTLSTQMAASKKRTLNGNGEKMSQRDGHEWINVPWNSIAKCQEDGCQENARWEKVLIACDKSSYDGGMYCHEHSSEDGNLLASENGNLEARKEKDKFDQITKGHKRITESVRTQSGRIIQPYEHDCDNCIWAGWVPFADAECGWGNMYFCPPPGVRGTGKGSIIIRYGDKGHEYLSTLVGGVTKGSFEIRG